MYIFHSEISRIGMCTFLSGFFLSVTINEKGDFYHEKRTDYSN